MRQRSGSLLNGHGRTRAPKYFARCLVVITSLSLSK
jgi:hypothetical protein